MLIITGLDTFEIDRKGQTEHDVNGIIQTMSEKCIKEQINKSGDTELLTTGNIVLFFFLTHPKLIK